MVEQVELVAARNQVQVLTYDDALSIAGEEVLAFQCILAFWRFYLK